MNWIVSLVGVIMVTVGVIVLLRPLTARALLNFFSQGSKRIYSLGVIRIILGLLLLFSAQKTRAYFFVITIGVIIFTAGLLVFFIPREKLMAIISYWKEKPFYIFRLLSFLVMAIGFGLVYVAF